MINTSLQFPFLLISMSCVDIMCMGALWDKLYSFSFIHYFLKEFIRLVLYLHQIFDRIYQVTHSCLYFICGKVVKYEFNINILSLYVYMSVLVTFVLKGILPLYLICWIYWHKDCRVCMVGSESLISFHILVNYFVSLCLIHLAILFILSKH